MTGPPDATRRPRDTSILVALSAGHVVVAAGAVVVAVLLVWYRLTEPHRSDGTAAAFLTTALVALVIGQALSVRRLHAHRRAVAAGRLDEEALALGARRLGWPVVSGYYPAIAGATELIIDTAPAGLFALVAAVNLGSLLLDHTHAGWIHGRAATTSTGHPALLAGSGRRIRSGQRLSVPLVLLLTAIPTGALVTECIGASRGGISPTDVVEAVAALSIVLLGLLLIRPLRLVGRAVHDDDTVHSTTLAAAAALLRRTGPIAAVAAALTVAAILTRPDLADVVVISVVATFLPLVALVGVDALQLGSITGITLNDAVALGGRRNRGVRGAAER